MRTVTILILALFTLHTSCQTEMKQAGPSELPEIEQSEIKADVLYIYESAFEKYNDGDFMGYMDLFWKSDSLRTVMYDKSFYGWDNIIASQLQTDPNFENLGTVTRLEIKLEVLSKDAVMIFDRYHIQLSRSSTYGAATSLMRFFDGKWQIVHSHISSSS